MTDDTRAGVDNAADDHAFLSGYLDGELTVDERVQVEAQLAASAELRAELDEIAVARAAVRGLPRRDAPTGFWEAVVANVEAADAESTVDDDGDERAEGGAVVAIGSRRSRRSLAGWIAGAAAVAAAVIAVIVVPGRTAVHPDVTAVATQHAAATSNLGDSISSLVPMGPLAGRR